MIRIMNQHLEKDGIVVISNHYYSELKTLANALPSRITDEMCSIEPSDLAPYKTEGIQNFFQGLNYAVLFYDRFMNAIVNYSPIEQAENPACETSRYSYTGTGGFGF